jgi:hypothetical protein
MSELANQVIKSFALSGFLPGKPDQSQQAGAEEPDGGGYRNRIDLNSAAGTGTGLISTPTVPNFF